MPEIQIFLTSLLSRKFLLAVTTALGLWSQKRYLEAAGIVLAWLTAEGVADVKSRAAGTSVGQDPPPDANAVAAELLKALTSQPVSASSSSPWPPPVPTSAL